MARIRSLHPGFFTDEEFVNVSMGARLLLLGLGVEADDKGIFEWRPSRLKMRIFPVDNVFVPDLLAELIGINALRYYEIDGREYGAIRNFRRFQRPKTPNDVHPTSADIRIYVGLPAAGSEKPKAEKDPIPPKAEKQPRKPRQFPRKGEKSPQMEDGGGRREDGNPSLPEDRTSQGNTGGEALNDDEPFGVVA